ncbi:MAG TPA: hypothetical protein VG755_25370 [Nannocystaceae bacterium]|nr:hypothetical protein [Nannocystaceae bacterium]
MRELEGWGTPPPQSGFVDRVLARADSERASRRRAWALPFALGSVAGGLVVGLVLGLQRESKDTRAAEAIELQLPGIVEIVGEPGAELRWDRTPDGRVVVEVIEGTAWVRTIDAQALDLRADDEPAIIGGECGRIAVARGLFAVDVEVDRVDCANVAELSRDGSR